MSTAKTYVLDANVFIEAKRRYYAFDLCPGFWEALLWHQAQGNLGSIDRVKAELRRGGDDLSSWANDVMPGVCFASTTDQSVIDRFGEAVRWVQAQRQFLPEAKAKFAESADGWLIAYAKETGKTLVTQEVAAKEARKKVPIPNVCEAFGVAYLDTFTMLNDLQVRFVWQPLTTEPTAT
jgi:Domain of unknown function (DUF4411)